MAPGFKDSISSSAKKTELFRNATRDYLINAALLLQPEDGGSNGMNRFYQMKINSLMNEDEDDVNYIVKLSENSTRCTKCGITRTLKIKSRKKENKSSDRRYCRYLRSLCKEICDNCRHCKIHKLIGRKSIRQALLANKEASHKRVIKTSNPAQKPKIKIAPEKKKKIIEKIIPIKTQLNPPSFSSRLRAFSCLLKK